MAQQLLVNHSHHITHCDSFSTTVGMTDSMPRDSKRPRSSANGGSSWPYTSSSIGSLTVSPSNTSGSFVRCCCNSINRVYRHNLATCAGHSASASSLEFCVMSLSSFFPASDRSLTSSAFSCSCKLEASMVRLNFNPSLVRQSCTYHKHV